MTLRRATLYVGGGTLLVAWFSSAASMSLGRYSRRPSTVDRDTSPRTDALAVSVQTQARRLAQRLAKAPVPQQPIRNPFAFGALPVVRRATPARMAAPEPEPAPLAAAIVEPAMVLVGLAERRVGDGVVRSAVISGDGLDLIMAEVGTVILGYTVTSIGNDAVEMKETSTGRFRRLVLQHP